jgi:hypothetical protein
MSRSPQPPSLRLAQAVTSDVAIELQGGRASWFFDGESDSKAASSAPRAASSASRRTGREPVVSIVAPAAGAIERGAQVVLARAGVTATRLSA